MRAVPRIFLGAVALIAAVFSLLVFFGRESPMTALHPTGPLDNSDSVSEVSLDPLPTRTPDRTADVPRAEHEGADVHQVEVTFRYLSSGRLCEEGEWALTTTVHDPVTHMVQGPRAKLPEGMWAITSMNPALESLRDELAVLREQDNTVWVTSSEPASIIVLSRADDRPIAGAFGTWRAPVALRSAFSDLVTNGHLSPVSAVSDRAGLLVFDDVIDAQLGEVQVSAAGYNPLVVHIQGKAGHEPRRVYLSSSDRASRRVCLVALESGRRLAGIEVTSTNRAALVGVSDSQGAIALPGWLESSDWLLVRGNGVAPWEVRVPEGDTDSLQIPVAAAGTVSLSGSGGGSTRAWVEVDGEESPAGRPHRQRVEVVPGEPCALELPRAFTATLSAVDDAGSSGSCSVLNPLEGWHADIALSGVKSLQIRPTPPVPGLEARVTYRSGRSAARYRCSPADGLITIPYPDEAVGVSLGAPGHSPLYLRPHGDEPRSGVLVIRIPEKHPTRVQLVDAIGSAIGQRMALSFFPQSSWIQTYPDLAGGYPSNHPAWSVNTNSTTTVATNADGTAVAYLAPGEYQLQPDTLPWLHGSGDSLYFANRSGPLFVPAQGTTTITVSPPRFVSLEVFGRLDGRPVESFRFGRQSGHLTPVSGFAWQGWISSDVSELRVGTPSLGYEVVDLAEGLDAFSTVVLLGANAKMNLLFEPAYEGLDIPYSVVASGALGDVNLFHATAPILDQRASIAAPVDVQGSIVLHRVRLGGMLYEATPSKIPFVEGGTTSVALTRVGEVAD